MPNIPLSDEQLCLLAAKLKEEYLAQPLPRMAGYVSPLVAEQNFDYLPWRARKHTHNTRLAIHRWWQSEQTTKDS